MASRSIKISGSIQDKETKKAIREPRVEAYNKTVLHRNRCLKY
jgi:hypothetical protein